MTLVWHPLGLVLLPEIATETIAAALTVRSVLAVLPYLRTLDFLLIDMYLLLLVTLLVVVAVILALRITFDVGVWQLGFNQIHLGAELGGLSQLRISLCGRGATE